MVPELSEEEEKRVENLLDDSIDHNVDFAQYGIEDSELNRLIDIDSKLQRMVPAAEWQNKLIMNGPLTPASVSSKGIDYYVNSPK